MSEATPIPRSRIKRHLLSWGTGTFDPEPGTPHNYSLTVLLESGKYLEPLAASNVIGEKTVVFAPTDADPIALPHGAALVQYDGPVAMTGDEISIGDDFFLQLQDYATSAYMSVLGPALVRVTSDEDFAAYVADADLARETGDFPSFLVASPVQLADAAGLGAGLGIDGPGLRLFVNESGEVSTSLGGRSLGTLEDGFSQLLARWEERNAQSSQPCGVCLGGVLDEQTRVEGLTERPWLGRYLAAIRARQDLHARGIAKARVSGFGVRLVDELAGVAQAADATRTELPILLWNGDEAYVYSPARRVFKISHEVARLVECLLVTGAVEAAAEYANAQAVAAVAQRFAAAGVPLILSEAEASA